ncbi:hypothetical protein CkaCkLH20_06143 [Colletotrichum karsti]|uniref:Uncharacterized protein n=1 Tax=Colletotrichum karsti TaxID=1095194 RepID=A0A9P6I5J0_9PEZI|nr:uncharacterized protein CkaCkLH20_06143 [Colletotrichum karsti]KAF9876200.1 hypothetical protein CkaCkLH20_06143 [Colletotrichum karsti]
MVLPRAHKRSASDQTGTMPFHNNKQSGGSPRYAFRNKASSQGFSPLKSSSSAGRKAKAVKLPKHVPQTWNTNADKDGSGDDEAPVKAFTPALKPLPVAPAELMERITSEPLAPIADDDDNVESTTAQASTVSEPSAERYITSTATATPASAATVSIAGGAAAHGAAARASASLAIPAPATGIGAATDGFPRYRRPAHMDAPMPTPPDEPAQNANGPPAINPVAGPILNYSNVQRQPLTLPRIARTYDYWTRLTLDGATVEAPKLPGCGPWEIPLPPNMDTRVHVDNNASLVFHYLGVHVTSKRYPPVIKIDLYPAQRIQETVTPFIIEDHAACRWRAWKIIFDWAEQLKIHGSAPANPPLDILTFIRNRAHQTGRLARDSALRAIEGHQQSPMFGGLAIWQLPARTHVVYYPNEAAAARPNPVRPNIAQGQADKKPAPANNAGANNAQKKPATKKAAAPKAAASKTVAPKIEPGTAGAKRQGPVINISSDSEEEEEEEQPQPKKRRQAK